ncbi:MAG TPA: hypothetical protein VGE98_12100 [Thermoanaerobaculia bacterium]
MRKPLYPTVRVTLRSRNRFAWVSAIRSALRRSGIAHDEIERFTRVALLTGNRRRFEEFCRLWVQVDGPAATESAGSM